MASPEKIAPLLPETLPEDFSDWDSEASPVPVPGQLWRVGGIGSRSFLRQVSKTAWSIR